MRRSENSSTEMRIELKSFDDKMRLFKVRKQLKYNGDRIFIDDDLTKTRE